MFKTGKIPPEILEDIVMNPIRKNNVQRDDVVLRPKTGEDCSAIDLQGRTVCFVYRPHYWGSKGYWLFGSSNKL